MPALAYAATQTFDQDNRLLTHNGAGTTFDADGNLLAIASGVAPASYTYDARNRLTAAGGLAYTYDAENRRVAVTQGSDVTSYVVNPHAVPDQVLVRTAPNGTKTYYVYGLGLLHEQTGSTLRYYHHDRRGDTVMLTDETGAVTDRMGYGLYGELAARTGTTDTPFLFNGRWGVQTDGNGLYYHRARYYHPALRRFLNQDSVLGEIAASASLNRFAYANGEPVSLIDPFGLAAQDASNSGGGNWFMRALAAIGEGMYEQAVWEHRGNMIAAEVIRDLPYNMTVGAAKSAARNWNEGNNAYYQGDYLMMGLHTAASFGDVASLGLLSGSAFKGAVSGLRFSLAAESGALRGVQLNKAIGDATADAIAARYPLALREVPMNTVGGVRRIDVLTLGERNIAIESKVGLTGLDSRIRQELARDWWLRRTGKVDDVIWEFTPSPITGQGGATPALLEKLNKLGIGTVGP